jgi:hypothetical protein
MTWRVSHAVEVFRVFFFVLFTGGKELCLHGHWLWSQYAYRSLASTHHVLRPVSAPSASIETVVPDAVPATLALALALGIQFGCYGAKGWAAEWPKWSPVVAPPRSRTTLCGTWTRVEFRGTLSCPSFLHIPEIHPLYLRNGAGESTPRIRTFKESPSNHPAHAISSLSVA